MQIRKLVAGFAFWTAASGVAVAAPCAGFTDTDDAVVGTAFCQNVEWVRNRQITFGCPGVNLYCPNAPVTRLQMAAFLNRLGNALEPVFLHRTQAGASAVVNGGGPLGGVLCQTTPYMVTNYPRIASSTVMVYHSAAAVQPVDARQVYSLNAGGTWSDFSNFVTFTANVAGQYASQSPVAQPRVFQPGDSVQFGVRVAGSSTTDAGCELTVRLDSHTGTSSPFDAAPREAQQFN